MALVIWGRLSSINVQKVVWCADELGLAYERHDVGGRFGGVDTPRYLAMNPNGLVPTVDDDGFVLNESNAIVRYLAAREGAATLWPEALKARADVDRWMEWQSTEFTPATRDAFWHLVRTAPEARDGGAIEASRQKTEKRTAVLDAHLANRRYIAGDTFTLADLVNGCAAYRWLHMPIARVPRPNLERWYAEISSRPASRQVTSVPLT
jgi:glutathione S-transferase